MGVCASSQCTEWMWAGEGCGTAYWVCGMARAWHREGMGQPELHWGWRDVG